MSDNRDNRAGYWCDKYHEAAAQLEASKQRELELLAVIAKAGGLLQEYGFAEGVEILCASPSEALREHEANLMDDIAMIFVKHPIFNLCDAANELGRMAEERRKKCQTTT